MKPHALVVGGTGMLKDVCLWLVEQGYNVSVIGRNQRRLDDVVNEASDSTSIIPISVDYRDEKLFLKMINDIKNECGPVTLVVSWIHSNASDSFHNLMEQLSKPPTAFWRLFHVRGSAAHLSSTSILAPEGCLYRQIQLGFVLGETHSRWLTNEEIATGIIKAIQEDQEKYVVGILEPWDSRP